MSKIQGLPPQFSPYQGSLQQQAYAALLAPSSGMGEDVIIPLTILSSISALIGAGALIYLATSGKAPETAQATPQLQPRPEQKQTEGSQRSQPSPDPPGPGLAPPGPKSGTELPGTFDGHGFYREDQRKSGGRMTCGMHALNFVLVSLYGAEHRITLEEFTKRFKEAPVDMERLKALLVEKGFVADDVMRVMSMTQVEQKKVLKQSRLKNANGFILNVPCGALPELHGGNMSTSDLNLHKQAENFVTHWVAAATKGDGRWHFYDSLNPKVDKSFPGPAYKAIIAYEKDRYGGTEKASPVFSPDVLVIHPIPK